MTPPNPAPSADAWEAILSLPIGDRRAWPMMRTALHIADQTLAIIPAATADMDLERLREAIATATYRQLRDYDALTYPQTPPAQPAAVCTGDPDEIRQWLTGPVHAHDPHNLAHYLDLNHTWHTAPPDLAARLAPVLREAQYDGVFGLPDHEILLVQAVRPEADGPEFFINIQPPMGPQLMIGYLTPTDLLGGQTAAVDIAVHALATMARDVNGVLRDQAALLSSAAEQAVLWTGQQAQPPPASRAFAAPPNTPPAKPPHEGGQAGPASQRTRRHSL